MQSLEFAQRNNLRPVLVSKGFLFKRLEINWIVHKIKNAVILILQKIIDVRFQDDLVNNMNAKGSCSKLRPNLFDWGT